MLAACLNVPETASDWQNWAWNAKDQTDLINQAILNKYGISLTSYVLIPFTATNQWLQNVSSSHSDFNSVLGLQGHDLQVLDFNNQDEVASWVNLAYQELFDASSSLEI